jgi:sugar phosphate isomerase/epimerase
MECCLFAKAFGRIALEEIAQRTREAGFDGVDLPVRPKGAILPEEARTRLPEAAKICQDHGLTLPMIVSAITSLDSEHAEDIVAACAEIGCRHIRTGSWHYEPGRYWEQVQAARRDLEGLEKLAEKHDVCLQPQQHSGGALNSTCASTFNLVKDRDPRYIGIQADPGHVGIEGERQDMGLDIMRTHIASVNIKSARYYAAADRETGAFRWQVKWVPLNEGLVDWRQVLTVLKGFGFSGPFCFHAEQSDRTDEQRVEITAKDCAWLRPVMAKLGF